VKFPDFKQYIPDQWYKNPKKANCKFFWAIFVTIQRDYVMRLLGESRALRRTRKLESKKLEAEPVISKHWI
jgi:hypothetical protein